VLSLKHKRDLDGAWEKEEGGQRKGKETSFPAGTVVPNLEMGGGDPFGVQGGTQGGLDVTLNTSQSRKGPGGPWGKGECRPEMEGRRIGRPEKRRKGGHQTGRGTGDRQ